MRICEPQLKVIDGSMENTFPCSVSKRYRLLYSIFSFFVLCVCRKTAYVKPADRFMQSRVEESRLRVMVYGRRKSDERYHVSKFVAKRRYKEQTLTSTSISTNQESQKKEATTQALTTQLGRG
jgi:hypothetical protein